MLIEAVNTYLAVRRAAGFALRYADVQLKSFAAFSDTRGQQTISADSAIEWAGLARSASQRACRLGTVIRFARYLRAEDPRHAVPPAVFGAERLPQGPGRARPTPHSLRHAFAIRSLQTCPDGRDAITKHMVALSTYLGHSTVAHTYWYLEAVPDLMRDIAAHAEQFAMEGRKL